MARLLILLVIVSAGCAQGPQVYDPHGNSSDPPLRLEVTGASLVGGHLRLTGRVEDAEYGEPVPASVGLGRWGERVLADSAGAFVFEAEGVGGRDTLVVYHAGWAPLMERVSGLVLDS